MACIVASTVAAQDALLGLPIRPFNFGVAFSQLGVRS
jgi:hypothetical protein